MEPIKCLVDAISFYSNAFALTKDIDEQINKMVFNHKLI